MSEVHTPTGKRMLNGMEKCAVVLMLLGEDEAANMLKFLSPREVQTLGQAMFAVARVEQAAVNNVLEEFISCMREQTSLGLGSEPYIKNVFVKALGEDRAGSVLSRITPAANQKSMEILQWMDARSIAEMIVSEHPQIIAIVISHLDHELAAEVLQLLPEAMQADVLRRVALLDAVQPEAIAELEQVMQKQFAATTSRSASTIGGINAAAKIVNLISSQSGQRNIGEIVDVDGDLGQALQDNMFVFNNLLDIDEKSLQTLLRSIEADTLVLALKGATEPLRDKFFACMSSRAAQGVKDEIEAKGRVRVSEVNDAQRKIVNTARQLADSGAIMLSSQGGDYV